MNDKIEKLIINVLLMCENDYYNRSRIFTQNNIQSGLDVVTCLNFDLKLQSHNFG